MKTVYLSISLHCLQFLLSVSYGIQVQVFYLRFIPKYFILFDVIVNGIVSLISLSESFLLLVYRNTTDYCILILYLATLPNSLMSSSSFLVASLGFSMYSMMSSANSDSCTSSFPIWIPFISFFFFLYDCCG